MIGILKACADRQLFGIDLWPGQERILASIAEAGRLHMVCCGRRSGKTLMAAIVALHDACFRADLASFLRPGEKRRVVVVATNLKQARILLEQARSIVMASPLLAPLVESSNEDSITFSTSVVLEAMPCTARALRGLPISTLVLDELAFFVDSEGNSAAEEVWRALVPSTLQFGDQARILPLSTPYGTDGLFASLYTQASTGELADAVAHRYPTSEMNPTISPEALAAEQARDPVSFRSEYLAEFVGSGGAFLDPDVLGDAVAERGELAPEEGVDWIAGLDPSFSRDPTGLAIVGRDPRDRRRLVLGLARAWRPDPGHRDSFEQRRLAEDRVLAEVAEICKKYRARVVTDQHCAPAVIARLSEAGLQVSTMAWSAASKTDAYGEVRARLVAGELELYDAPGLVPELTRLRTRYSAGSASVVSPRVAGSHGDQASGLAAAVFQFSGARTPGWPEGYKPRLDPQVTRGILTKRF